MSGQDARKVVDTIAGLEAAQLRALGAALARLYPDTRVNLKLTDDGFLHAEVVGRGGSSAWLTVTDTAMVISSIGRIGPD